MLVSVPWFTGIGQPAAEYDRRAEYVRVFLAVMVVLLILLLIFAVQNPGSTDVTFLTFSSTVPLLLIIVVSAVVGLLLGVAITLPGSLRRGSRVRKLESEAGKLQSQTADRLSALEESRPEPADTKSTKSGDSTKGS